MIAQREDVTPRLTAMPLNTILCGDALDVLRSLPDACVDAIVTDPPAGISFMGKGWDSDKGGREQWIAWLSAVMREALRVVKPGGHALVWALPRTSHWTGMALEDAGWEVREKIAHWFGSGFPKSHNISVAIDKMAGAQRQKTRPVAVPARNRNGTHALGGSWQDEPWETTPATDAASAWDGWGTALKPAYEDWWLVRKPLDEKTIAANVLAHGTGALHIAACRVASDVSPKPWVTPRGGIWRTDSTATAALANNPAGRWPPNLLLSHAADCVEDGPCSLWCPVRALGEQSGTDKARPTWAGIAGHQRAKRTKGRTPAHLYGAYTNSSECVTHAYDDTGTAARFFPTFRYVAKASRSERNRGCEGLPTRAMDVFGDDEWGKRERANVKPSANHHPTVKPLALMSWLITLITPPGGIVLDPFAGSGSTLCAAKAGGWRYLGIEREAEYVAICEARLEATPPCS